MYPYHLGCHLKSGQLCRIPHPALGIGIPKGCVRVLSYKQKIHTHIQKYWTVPYKIDGELKNYYMSIPRWCDIQRERGEEVTGPNMGIVIVGLSGMLNENK